MKKIRMVGYRCICMVLLSACSMKQEKPADSTSQESSFDLGGSSADAGLPEDAKGQEQPYCVTFHSVSWERPGARGQSHRKTYRQPPHQCRRFCR